MRRRRRCYRRASGPVTSATGENDQEVRLGRRPRAHRNPHADRRRRRGPDTGPGGRVSNREIATEQVVAEATIRSHITRILMKLDLGDRVQTVIFAYESGVIRPAATPG
jgi:Bacterial regulatory proteins, luxR family